MKNYISRKQTLSSINSKYGEFKHFPGRFKSWQLLNNHREHRALIASASFQSQFRERSNLLIHINLQRSFTLKAVFSAALFSAEPDAWVARSPASIDTAEVTFMAEEDWVIVKLDPAQFEKVVGDSVELLCPGLGRCDGG
ncbi:hypothetical protein F2Q70_00003204 [Brassica cretica]|uniref:Uncharacterized protein n=1 Tax=Brassica cretica TaxID=69181 RepID=A0A8S9IT98_BRACR|nr:hypothetical protein F2Q70_00003204 [Brassica cretica]